MFTEMRLLRQSTGDDHLVLELGMDFLTADDMLGILAVKLKKSLGFGIWAKLHITGMYVEGKERIERRLRYLKSQKEKLESMSLFKVCEAVGIENFTLNLLQKILCDCQRSVPVILGRAQVHSFHFYVPDCQCG